MNTQVELDKIEDLRLAGAASDLRETYGGHWGKHPEYPLEQWQDEVRNNDTRLGYWEWIANSQAGVEIEPVASATVEEA